MHSSSSHKTLSAVSPGSLVTTPLNSYGVSYCSLASFFFNITAELYLSPCRAFLPHLTSLKLLLKISPQGTSLVGQWLRPHVPNAEGPGSIPGQGTRSHMLQVKIMCTATKTQSSQKKTKKKANINIKNRLVHNMKVGRRAWGPQGLRGTLRLSPTSRDPPTSSFRVVLSHSVKSLCDPMDCRPPGSSVHGIILARILEWVAFPSRRSSQPRDQTQVS